MEEAEEPTESIFASVTDLMVGVLFVFLLLLTYFALDFQAASDAIEQAAENRADVVSELAQRLERQNIPVSVDPRAGIIRLPDSLLFEKGSADLTPAGTVAVGQIGANLATLLADFPGQVDTVLVEGHTDDDPIAPGARYADNYELSAARAIATRRALLARAPALAGAADQSLVGVAGYGPDRPIASGGAEAAKRQNRRIDLRIVVTLPSQR